MPPTNDHVVNNISEGHILHHLMVHMIKSPMPNINTLSAVFLGWHTNHSRLECELTVGSCWRNDIHEETVNAMFFNSF